MLDKKETQKTLEYFNKYVIQQARTNLTKGRRNVTRDLYDSLSAKLNVHQNSFSDEFYMETYGQFQDKGVKGKFSSSRAPNSPFRFGSGSGQSGGLTQGIKKWVRAKRFQFQDRKTGKFLSYDSTAFLITRSIYAKGLKPTNFFTTPFERAFEKLPDELILAFGLDVETFLKYTLNGSTKT